MTEPSLKHNAAVVIPCYNAGARVSAAAAGALAHVDAVIVVDDGCTDGCIAPLETMPVQLLRFEHNRGKGHALIAGIAQASLLPHLEAIILMDADGQHDPCELPALYAAYRREGADLVIGARCFDQGRIPWRSRFGNKATAMVTAWLFRRRLPDTQSGYRVLSPAFARAFVARATGGRYETEMEMLLLAIFDKVKIVSVPIAAIYEPGNRSSHFRKFRDSARIYAALARAAIVLRFHSQPPA